MLRNQLVAFEAHCDAEVDVLVPRNHHHYLSMIKDELFLQQCACRS